MTEQQQQKEILQAGDEGVLTEFDAELEELEELEQLEQSTELVVQRAQALEITNDAEYQAAGKFLTEELKPVLAEIEATFKPIIAAANKAHKEAIAQKKRHSEPLLEAERIVKGSMGVYHQEQQRIARQREAERLAAARKEAEERALAEAAALEEMGEHEIAEEIIEQPVATVVTTAAPAPPTAAGTSVRMVHKYRIVSAAKIDRRFLIPDEKKIGQIVRSMGKDAEAVVGGIQVYEEPVVAARAR